MAVNGIMGKGVPAGLPPFLLYIRIAIIFLSVIVLALAAWAIAVFGSVTGYYVGSNGVSGLLIFAVIKTWLIYGILTFVELRAQHMYYRIIAIIAYTISIIFWLSAWAWSASVAGLWLSAGNDFGYYDDVDESYYDSYVKAWKNEGAALAACAGLGAVIWVLSIVHLVFLVRACMHDTGSTGNQAELGQVGAGKTEATSTVYPATQPTPVQYGQPGVYQTQPAYGQPAPAYGQPQQPYPSS